MATKVAQQWHARTKHLCNDHALRVAPPKQLPTQQTEYAPKKSWCGHVQGAVTDSAPREGGDRLSPKLCVTRE